MDDFRNKWKPSRTYHKINTFRGEQYTKEGHGKSMKNALHVGMEKGTSRTKVTSSSEKNQARSLSHCQVCRHQAGS